MTSVREEGREGDFLVEFISKREEGKRGGEKRYLLFEVISKGEMSKRGGESRN